MPRKPKYENLQPSFVQTEFILANKKISYRALAKKFRVPIPVAKRWHQDIHGERIKKNPIRFESAADLEEHYHILCMWYLRGFSIRDILISYCGELNHDEIITALTYKDGAIFKKSYKRIKFAGNDVSINDDSELGKELKEKVKEWDEYFSRFEHGRSFKFYDDTI